MILDVEVNCGSAERGDSCVTQRRRAQSFGPQPVEHYLIRKSASNSVSVRPPVGKRFSEEQWAAIREWIVATGRWTAIRHPGEQSLLAIAYHHGALWSEFPSSSFVSKKKRAEAAALAESDRVKKAIQEETASLLQTQAGKWVRGYIGEDLLGDYNAARLADAISATDPSKRQLRSFLLNWQVGEKLKADGLPEDVVDTKGLVSWLRQRMLNELAV